MKVKKNPLYYINTGVFLILTIYSLLVNIRIFDKDNIDMNAGLCAVIVSMVLCIIMYLIHVTRLTNMLYSNPILKTTLEVISVLIFLTFSCVIRVYMMGEFELDITREGIILLCLFMAYVTARMLNQFGFVTLLLLTPWPYLIGMYNYEMQQLIQMAAIIGGICVLSLILFAGRKKKGFRTTAMALFVLAVIVYFYYAMYRAGIHSVYIENYKKYIEYFNKLFVFSEFERYYYIAVVMAAIIGGIRLFLGPGSANTLILFVVNALCFFTITFDLGTMYLQFMYPLLAIAASGALGTRPSYMDEEVQLKDNLEKVEVAYNKKDVVGLSYVDDSELDRMLEDIEGSQKYSAHKRFSTAQHEPEEEDNGEIPIELTMYDSASSRFAEEKPVSAPSAKPQPVQEAVPVSQPVMEPVAEAPVYEPVMEPVREKVTEPEMPQYEYRKAPVAEPYQNITNESVVSEPEYHYEEPKASYEPEYHYEESKASYEPEYSYEEPKISYEPEYHHEEEIPVAEKVMETPIYEPVMEPVQEAVTEPQMPEYEYRKESVAEPIVSEPEYHYEEPKASSEPEYHYEEPKVSSELEYHYEEPKALYEPEYNYEEPKVSYEPEYNYEEPKASSEPEYHYEEPKVSSEPEYHYEEPKVSSEPEYHYEEPKVSYEPEYSYEEPKASNEPEYHYEEEIPVVEEAMETPVYEPVMEPVQETVIKPEIPEYEYSKEPEEKPSQEIVEEPVYEENVQQEPQKIVNPVVIENPAAFNSDRNSETTSSESSDYEFIQSRPMFETMASFFSNSMGDETAPRFEMSQQDAQSFDAHSAANEIYTPIDSLDELFVNTDAGLDFEEMEIVQPASETKTAEETAKPVIQTPVQEEKPAFDFTDTFAPIILEHPADEEEETVEEPVLKPKEPEEEIVQPETIELGLDLEEDFGFGNAQSFTDFYDTPDSAPAFTEFEEIQETEPEPETEETKITPAIDSVNEEIITNPLMEEPVINTPVVQEVFEEPVREAEVPLSVAEQVPIVEQMPVAEQIPVVEQVPVAEQMPVVEQVPVPEQVPVAQQVSAEPAIEPVNPFAKEADFFDWSKFDDSALIEQETVAEETADEPVKPKSSDDFDEFVWTDDMIKQFGSGVEETAPNVVEETVADAAKETAPNVVEETAEDALKEIAATAVVEPVIEAVEEEETPQYQVFQSTGNVKLEEPEEEAPQYQVFQSTGNFHLEEPVEEEAPQYQVFQSTGNFKLEEPEEEAAPILKTYGEPEPEEKKPEPKPAAGSKYGDFEFDLDLPDFEPFDATKR